jgi:hypothetical protein
MSQPSASVAPAPAATPLTAQMTGFGSFAGGAPAGYRRFQRTSPDPAPGRGVDVAVVQILTGAKAASRPGDQQAANGVITLGLFQALGKLLVHHVVKAVQTLRTVQRNGHYALLNMTENKFHN